MYLEEWKQKPKNKYMIMLKRCGEPTLQIDSYTGIINYRPAKDITNVTVTVYNIETDRMSDKAAYMDKSGRLYIRCSKGWGSNTERIHLDDFLTDNTQ
jgi:hypothetical protein